MINIAANGNEKYRKSINNSIKAKFELERILNNEFGYFKQNLQSI